ncbi:MAG: hypothetical protein A2725_04385 [Candidatus Magasanikbacteria bacterium RIFCSPHIGHO2_01_FULL_33_34]|uniref:Nudix hydrolase domain-containing protein n=1 Tax=Candidatus Magasanikbacteria bacterium RIFCSPHIGHO2_01_FULL_33_34 TaxID=1798671 RepID=A0A1F6LI45_9BACT|nr:MAG: hypothetical protein A2725_04385 [Candidatus Magasanikbacteria bacterium RIFCSPHIGHO2_01_FULL_33_34]OGH65202.1 MAG: hypothetical protein A3B83_04145 [Candidatus Magasanikbacteria bacterium RIFCSPHIGHO2_02_FULL_33_17]OGH75253.1 MAG: hypothetical protein A3A89_04020 [Candidatus Magasanikbacteria bacterium RIFCSPLOWO2_01_FULL_33_34]OGH82175.1 MAG: hypothetical protein A3F93_00415 [Candidatus Magasanikbacteria bacterium RIFCSPLOWO2_12_FULL_34_7]
MENKDFSNFKDDAGAILINKKTRHIALVKMHHNIWGFPKGGIRENENILDAAKREVYEETGVKEVEVIKKLPTYQRANSYKPDEFITLNMYIFETEEDELKQIEYDIAEVKWVPIDEVMDILSIPADAEYFLSVRKYVK